MRKYKFLFTISLVQLGCNCVISLNKRKKEENNNFNKFLKSIDGKLKMKSLENFIQENLILGKKKKSDKSKIC